MRLALVGAADPITIDGKGLVPKLLDTNRRSVTLFYGGAEFYAIGAKP